MGCYSKAEIEAAEKAHAEATARLEEINRKLASATSAEAKGLCLDAHYAHNARGAASFILTDSEFHRGEAS
ncbi:hypothetical protein [Streptomyces sp. CBMA152]|uniref:hypothetical protein n=1 Tax=Streptomyces sp. CBMA152 TaxID=1896312 RepID=UPI0016606E3E|nr:hypothetical protein [Streptomyces sp. CBMA152]